MKKCRLIALCTVCTFAFMCYSVFAEEKHNYIGGSIGGEVWYADWESENQWSIEGVDIDYDIEPSIIYSYSASVNYTKRKKLFTGIILDYFTSKMEEEVNSQAFEGDEDDLGAYRKIKAKIDQRIGENDYFHLQVMYAKFEGDITVKEGGTALNVPTGTSWELDTKWFKADAMYLFDGVVGIGFRYLSYEKPETTSLFHVTGEAEGSLVEGDLISGEVVNTKFQSYNLLFGVWDPSYIGIPTDSWFFFDINAFIGISYAENEIIGKEDGWSGGLEGSLGLKYSYNFSDTFGFTGRLGFRGLYSKMTVSEETHKEDYYTVTETIDYWYGPFVGLTCFF